MYLPCRFQAARWPWQHGEGEDLADGGGGNARRLAARAPRPPLSQVNDAMAAMNHRNGGFTNFIVDPTRAE
jgi:hypothetical protein